MDIKERIENMENILDTSNELIKQFNSYLEKLEQNHNEIQKLKDYYHSEKWFEDDKYITDNNLIGTIKCGVLSQDTVYDLLTEYDNTAIKMLEFATKILKHF